MVKHIEFSTFTGTGATMNPFPQLVGERKGSKHSCRQTAQQGTGQTANYVQQLLQQKSRVSESSLPCLPSDTAAAFLAVDRSVYAALASSFVTFVICNLAWQSQKHGSDGIVSAVAGSSSSNNLVPSGSPKNGGGEKADGGSKAAQSIQSIGDPKDVRENDIWQVARSGLQQAGPGQPKPPKPAQQECAPTNVRLLQGIA